MHFYMCYLIQYLQKTPPLIKKNVINAINLGISNTEKYKEQNISYLNPCPQRKHSQQFLYIVLGGKKVIHVWVYVYACITFLLVLLILNNRYSA